MMAWANIAPAVVALRRAELGELVVSDPESSLVAPGCAPGVLHAERLLRVVVADDAHRMSVVLAAAPGINAGAGEHVKSRLDVHGNHDRNAEDQGIANVVDRVALGVVVEGVVGRF